MPLPIVTTLDNPDTITVIIDTNNVNFSSTFVSEPSYTVVLDGPPGPSAALDFPIDAYNRYILDGGSPADTTGA